MERNAKVFLNSETRAFVECFVPIQVYIYDSSGYPYALLNPLAKALMHDDPRFAEGRYLFDVVHDPEEADLLVFPCDLNYFEHREDEIFKSLPHYSQNEARHVFFDRRDTGRPVAPGTAIHFRTSLERQKVSPSMICIPYLEPIDNYFSYHRQPVNVLYDISFLGEWTEFREELITALHGHTDRVYFRLRESFFFGNYMSRAHSSGSDEVANSQREEYIQVTRQSRFVLAPMGHGLNSFRFFEAFSLGVPPILVSRDCALPFEHLIDYDAICLRFDACDPDVAAKIAAAVKSIEPCQHEEMRRLGRLYFDAYLSPRNIMFLLHQFLERAMQRRGCERAV
jgi:hypothetical protein